MGFFDRLLGREQFSSQWSVSDPAFAAWWFRNDPSFESVTWATVWGLSAAQRAIQIITTAIGALPLRSYERQGDERVRIPSEFDDPYPGFDGLTPFSWTETVLIHLLLWRKAFLWHEQRADGKPGFAYRPVIPDAFTKIELVNGRRQFTYRDGDGNEKTVGSEQVTFIPGPSVNGVDGQDILFACRAIYSAAISGDKTAQATLSRGIRIGGLVTPRDENEDIDKDESEAIIETLSSKMLGPQNAGALAFINKRLQINPWAQNNVESEMHQTRMDVLLQIEQLFGVPPHLMADTEKQTSWGTGVAEQNLGLARFTLMGWSSRIEQVLSMRLGPDQFCEYDYKGLLQGTPQQEIELLLAQTGKPFLTRDEARKVMNLPPLTPAQKAELDAAPAAAPSTNGNGHAALTDLVPVATGGRS